MPAAGVGPKELEEPEAISEGLRMGAVGVSHLVVPESTNPHTLLPLDEKRSQHLGGDPLIPVGLDDCAMRKYLSRILPVELSNHPFHNRIVCLATPEDWGCLPKGFPARPLGVYQSNPLLQCTPVAFIAFEIGPASLLEELGTLFIPSGHVNREECLEFIVM